MGVYLVGFLRRHIFKPKDEGIVVGIIHYGSGFSQK
jgi:hypothetical protein